VSASRNEALLSADGVVPTGPCPACEREVLVYLVDPEAEAEAYACVHCDGPVRGVDLREEADLDRLGYSATDPLAGGCATGCATGGCGGGTRSRTIDELLATARKL
jgi:hypothetical protein